MIKKYVQFLKTSVEGTYGFIVFEAVKNKKTVQKLKYRLKLVLFII